MPALLKRAKEAITFTTIPSGEFAGSQIAEIFDTSGDTRMSCGIHEVSNADVIVEVAPVDDVLYILEGEIEIEADGVRQTYHAGDFAYLRAGARQRYIVRDHVKHIYVCFPSNWKNG